ncbi:hypothetical protein [Streptomyces canus]
MNGAKVPPAAKLDCPGGRSGGLTMLSESGAVAVVIELDDDGLLAATDHP